MVRCDMMCDAASKVYIYEQKNATFLHKFGIGLLLKFWPHHQKILKRSVTLR